MGKKSLFAVAAVQALVRNNFNTALRCSRAVGPYENSARRIARFSLRTQRVPARCCACGVSALARPRHPERASAPTEDLASVHGIRSGSVNQSVLTSDEGIGNGGYASGPANFTIMTSSTYADSAARLYALR